MKVLSPSSSLIFSEQHWSPDKYEQFSSERLAPLLDLIKAIPPLDVPVNGSLTITDLGAGTGAAVDPLLSRWPDAHLTLVEQDPLMMAKLQTSEFGANVNLQQTDIANWAPDTPQDLIFSNAALHWLDDHETLFPKLISHLKPGGILALQMPNNWQQPSHKIMRDLAKNAIWSQRLLPLIRSAPVLPFTTYEQIISPHCAELSLWEKIYDHRLSGIMPVARWFEGSSLGPLLKALNKDEAGDFYQQYGEATNMAYGLSPTTQKEDTLVFPLRRLFIVAKKGIANR